MDQRRARGQRNREALISAATALFTANGYEQTTVEQISAAAGVAPRTFFHHFAAKDDILFDGYAERLAEATRRFRASRSDSLWEALTEASTAVASAITDHPDIFVVRARLYHSLPALRASMLRINEEWIDQMAGEVARWLQTDQTTDLRPRLAATLVNGANRAAIDTWMSCGGDLPTIMADALALLRPSISAIERADSGGDGGKRAG
ncbi:Fatty acid metabolism regulator protein [Mycolicibacterium vanbaalenii]|uniref:Fatty acid metabolism regulator protein n=1 Tax=Mycolicibacterium vanbaalenii TaxID=110539 RepID=A0A5S9MRY0_MYCVN|nr:TetR/AcrR family transcriptional regulator [Mycolicibacterium vanbaalenii]CAA0079345.1 Fatty acid metabolism regulator protein [Mycolicibacterium vanbaalenii]